MRIHRTASTALSNQIASRLSPDAKCPEHFEWRVRGLPHSYLNRFRFFAGHISPAALDVSGLLNVFTILREPRERLLSCYFYWRAQAPQNSGHQFYDAISKLSLVEFLKSRDPQIHRATYNVQARLLAGGQFGGIDRHRTNVFGPWLSESELADQAMRRFDRFAFVGTVDQYELSLRKAFDLLGLGAPPPPKLVNVNPARPESYGPLLVDVDIAHALSSLTAVDQLVYEKARSMAQQALSAAAPPCPDLGSSARIDHTGAISVITGRLPGWPRS